MKLLPFAFAFSFALATPCVTYGMISKVVDTSTDNYSDYTNPVVPVNILLGSGFAAASIKCFRAVDKFDCCRTRRFAAASLGAFAGLHYRSAHIIAHRYGEDCTDIAPLFAINGVVATGAILAGAHAYAHNQSVHSTFGTLAVLYILNAFNLFERMRN